MFRTGDAAVLAVRITAAMLAAFLPARPWQGHLELIWKLKTDDGLNRSALLSAERRFRRTSVTRRRRTTARWRQGKVRGSSAVTGLQLSIRRGF